MINTTNVPLTGKKLVEEVVSTLPNLEGKPVTELMGLLLDLTIKYGSTIKVRSQDPYPTSKSGLVIVKVRRETHEEAEDRLLGEHLKEASIKARLSGDIGKVLKASKDLRAWEEGTYKND